MTIKDKYNIRNIDEKNRIISDVVNRRYNQGPLSRIQNILSQVKKNSILSSPESLVGVCLWSNRMTMASFKAKYENMTTLFREITQKGEKTKDTNTVLETYVHIPELTGMLPYPDFTIIEKYLRLRNEAKDSDQFEKTQKEVEKEFKKITYYPRFYKAFDSAPTVGIERPVEVKTLKSSGLNTDAIGVFIKSLKIS